MALSYEFSIGAVRAREKKLFSAADIEQIINLKSESELLRFLRDKGYGEGETVEEILESNAENMWKYIESIAPDFSIFNIFLWQNDIHNIKTVLKGVMYGKEYSNLLLSPYTVEPDGIKDAFEHKKFGRLPEEFSSAAQEAYNLLARTRDARLSDAVIDRVALAMMITESEKTKSAFLAEYFGIFVFYANIKTALRASKYKASMEYLDKALCECEGFDKQKNIKAAMSGSETLIKYLEKISAYDCNKAMKRFAQSTGEFEKFIENKLLRLARDMCRLTSEGAEPLFGYYIGCEYERKAVHMISGGIATATSPDKIRERLRDIYG